MSVFCWEKVGRNTKKLQVLDYFENYFSSR